MSEIQTSVHGVARIETETIHYQNSRWREVRFVDADGRVLLTVTAFGTADAIPAIEERAR